MCETLLIAQREIRDLAVFGSDSLRRWRNNGSVIMSKLKDLVVSCFEYLINIH